MTAKHTPTVTPSALAEVACTLSITGSEVHVYCETREEAEEVFDWLEAHVGHREATEAASKAQIAELVDALDQTALELEEAAGVIEAAKFRSTAGIFALAAKRARALIAQHKGDDA